jgi:hypothetical protein
MSASHLVTRNVGFFMAQLSPIAAVNGQESSRVARGPMLLPESGRVEAELAI